MDPSMTEMNSDPECDGEMSMDTSNSSKHKRRSQKIKIQKRKKFRRNIVSFLHFLDSSRVIREFFNYDSHFRLADKYLIAMVFIYFERAGLTPQAYTRLKFFAALCLAHSMEEENQDLLGEIYPWALGIHNIKVLVPYLLGVKIRLWKAMNYRAFVSKYCCKKVMSVWPHHSIWRRTRISLETCESISYFGHFRPTNNIEMTQKTLKNRQ